ncbi:hypothetical protein [Desulforamulus ferrireducens]|uniref:hypothetical protein n=1 Tax=Desulforamulus ferrireducens TaxID=1833852 RepID=UPI001A9A5884|nr:hypothetical protein [Desulforamulus ferrireducens]
MLLKTAIPHFYCPGKSKQVDRLFREGSGAAAKLTILAGPITMKPKAKESY